jgi:hypothetical protein
MLTILLVVLWVGFLICFSQEFLNLIRKVMSVPGFKVTLPLLLASWVISLYEDWGQWLILKVQILLHQFIYQLSTLMPFETRNVLFLRIVFLFLLAGTPLWYSRCRIKFSKRRLAASSMYKLGLFLWIVAAMLIVVAI